LTVLLDAPVEVGLARAKNRSEADRFEAEDLAFFERMREVYLARARQYPKRIAVVNAHRPLDAVQADLSVCLEALCRIPARP
jgi:dTMP kinase